MPSVFTGFCMELKLILLITYEILLFKIFSCLATNQVFLLPTVHPDRRWNNHDSEHMTRVQHHGVCKLPCKRQNYMFCSLTSSKI